MEQSHAKKSEKHFWNAYTCTCKKNILYRFQASMHVDNWNIKAWRWHLLTYFNDAISNSGWNEFDLI